MLQHHFESFLGFVLTGLQKQEEPLIIVEVGVIFDVILDCPLLELNNLFQLIFVVLGLSEVEVAQPFLALLRLFLLL